MFEIITFSIWKLLTTNFENGFIDTVFSKLLCNPLWIPWFRIINKNGGVIVNNKNKPWTVLFLIENVKGMFSWLSIRRGGPLDPAFYSKYISLVVSESWMIVIIYFLPVCFPIDKLLHLQKGSLQRFSQVLWLSAPFTIFTATSLVLTSIWDFGLINPTMLLKKTNTLKRQMTNSAFHCTTMSSSIRVNVYCYGFTVKYVFLICVLIKYVFTLV